MRAQHCSFMVDNGRGRCIAPCHYNRDYDGIDCTGADGPTMQSLNHLEVPVTAGFIDGTHKEVRHDSDKGTWSIDNVYSPAINKSCNWGGMKTR